MKKKSDIVGINLGKGQKKLILSIIHVEIVLIHVEIVLIHVEIVLIHVEIVP